MTKTSQHIIVWYDANGDRNCYFTGELCTYSPNRANAKVYPTAAAARAVIESGDAGRARRARKVAGKLSDGCAMLLVEGA